MVTRKSKQAVKKKPERKKRQPSEKKLGVQRTPVLWQLLQSAEEALMTDDLFRSEFLETIRQSQTARWSIRIFLSALQAHTPMDWARLVSVYQAHLNYIQSAQEPISPRNIIVRAEGKRQIMEVLDLISADEEVVDQIVADRLSGGKKVPQVAALIFALQYTIDLYRTKEKEKANGKPA